MTGRPFYAALIAVSILWIVLSAAEPAQATQDAWAFATVAVVLLAGGRVAEHEEDHHGRR